MLDRVARLPGAPCLLARGTRLGGIVFYYVNGSCRAIPNRGMISLLRSRFLGCHAMHPPKKRLLTAAPHSFHEISQSRLPFHFQERFRAKSVL